MQIFFPLPAVKTDLPLHLVEFRSLAALSENHPSIKDSRWTGGSLSPQDGINGIIMWADNPAPSNTLFASLA